MAEFIERKAKSHKGRLHQQKMRPKVEEDDRATLFMRGVKASGTVLQALKLLVD